MDYYLFWIKSVGFPAEMGNSDLNCASVIVQLESGYT